MTILLLFHLGTLMIPLHPYAGPYACTYN